MKLVSERLDLRIDTAVSLWNSTFSNVNHSDLSKSKFILLI